MEADGETLGETEALGLTDADGETEGLALDEGLVLADGDTDGDSELDGLTLALGETLGDSDADGEDTPPLLSGSWVFCWKGLLSCRKLIVLPR